MKKVWQKIFKISNKDEKSQPDVIMRHSNGDVSVLEIKHRVERGAEDFATRFEGVMKELSNG